MQKRFRALHRAAVISPFLIFTILSLAWAQNRYLDMKEQATILTSDKVVTIRLITSGNREITVSQYDGEMIRIGPKDGEKLGITPHILNDEMVILDFFNVTKITKKSIVVGERVTSIGSIELNSTLPQSTPVGLMYAIQLISVSKAVEESRVKPNAKEQCPCCVVCNGQECCGLTVQMSCGSCSCL